MIKKLIPLLFICSLCLGDIFTSHIKPNADGTLDVGTSSLLWRYVYADSLTDGTALWTGHNLSGFTSISGTTLTDGTFTVSGGTISAGVWHGTVITVPYGGTGAATLTSGGLLVGSGTSTVSALAVASNGQLPIGDGTTAPTLATLTDGNAIDITNGAGTITIDVNYTDINSNETDPCYVLLGVPYTGATGAVNLGTQTLGAGAITGTSFIIGANTLDTTEWAYLDGQDQSVFTTSTPQFARLGIGTTASSAYGLIVSKAFSTGSCYGVGGEVISTAAISTTTNVGGLNFAGKWQPTNVLGNATVTSLCGANCEAYATQPTLTPVEDKNMTITNFDGVRGKLYLDRATATGTLTATYGKVFRAFDATKTIGTETITTLAAFYDEGMTAGGTNWGLAINTQSYINGNLRVGSAVVPTVALDVTGAGLFSTTLGVTGVATLTGGLIIPSGTTPAPDIQGAIFIDTDASTNGDLMIYGNSGWRKVISLP
jgi:hypothetical protein